MKLDTQRAYTVIQARPTAGLQRLRYLLLLWGADRNGANPMTPEEVHRVANERLMRDDAAGTACAGCDGAADAGARHRVDATASAVAACRGQ